MRESYLEKQTRRHARTSMGGLLRTAFRQQQESDTWPLQQAISQGHDSVLKWLLHYDRECADCPAQHVLKTLKNAGYKTTEKKSFNWGIPMFLVATLSRGPCNKLMRDTPLMTNCARLFFITI